MDTTIDQRCRVGSTTRRIGHCRTSSCPSKRCQLRPIGQHLAHRPLIPTRVPLEMSPVPPARRPQVLQAVVPSGALGSVTLVGPDGGLVNEHETTVQQCMREVTSVARSCDKLLYVLRLTILRSLHFINQLEAILMLELTMSA